MIIQPLTQRELTEMQEYFSKTDELREREPVRLSDETWEIVMQQIRETGEIPLAYRDKIGERTVTDIDGSTKRGFFDIEWEAWSAECSDLVSKHEEVLEHFILFVLDVVTENPKNVPIFLNEFVEKNRKYLDIYESVFAEKKAKKQKADLLRALPKLQSIAPKMHTIPNSRLVNTLPDGIIGTGTRKVNVSSKKGKKDIDILCNLSYEGDDLKLSGRQPFTEYDRNVYNAVSSLYVYGDASHIVTPATVYRTMTGMTATEDPSAQQIGAVTKSLDKMRFIRATVDCTAQLQERGLALDGESVTEGKIDTYLLNASVIQVQAGGHAVKAYLIDRTPVLYSYSKMLKEVLTIPSYLLDIKVVDQHGKITDSRISNSESRIQVKGYLIRRIEGMKGHNSLKSRTISMQSYEKDGKHHKGLYEIAGCDAAAPRKAQKAVRDYAEDVLNYWKASGYIKDYFFTKNGRTITGIEIRLPAS